MKKYEKPDLELLSLLVQDIVTGSIGEGGDDELGGPWDS